MFFLDSLFIYLFFYPKQETELSVTYDEEEKGLDFLGEEKGLKTVTKIQRGSRSEKCI